MRRVIPVAPYHVYATAGQVICGRASVRTAILGKRSRMTLYDREKLRAGHKFAGPALVVEAFATTWVPRDWGGTVDAEGNLLLRFRKTSGTRGKP